MPARITRRGTHGDHPEGPVSQTRGEPSTLIIVAVVGAIILLVIALWLWLG